jgi:hypothetical protein
MDDHEYDDDDVQQAANEVVLAMDGKIARADAVCVTKAVFRHLGMRHEDARPKPTEGIGPVPFDTGRLLDSLTIRVAK